MKDILIADAGGTKTDWSYLSDESEDFVRIKTDGINPIHDTKEKIFLQVLKVKEKIADKSVKKIYFFGAGCVNKELTQPLVEILRDFFNPEELSVESDLLGAAISLFADSKGIACILGTGSNSGIYFNGKITDKIPSLGYILGDEGGGVALGKALLNSIFKRTLPDYIIENFNNQYKLTVDELVNNVYKKSNSTAFIASFCPFLKNNIDDPAVFNLIKREFDNFFRNNIVSYENILDYKIGLVGSIAFNFREIIQLSASDFNIPIYRVLKNPLPELEKYFALK